MWFSAEAVGNQAVRGQSSAPGSGPPASEQPAGPLAGVLVVAPDFRPMHEGVPVAYRALHDAFAAGWKIMHDNRRFQVQVREIDYVEVGAIAGSDHTAVMESVGSGRGGCLFVDQKLERQFWAARPVAAPVGQQAGG